MSRADSLALFERSVFDEVDCDCRLNERGEDAAVGDIDEGTDDDATEEDSDNDEEISKFLLDLLVMLLPPGLFNVCICLLGSSSSGEFVVVL